ncbi:MAG TPA: hypothetical protein VI854_02990, partial [Acidimicrobiia bacterium]|nr:hypothetical protein [Acidimicrobiia bacterium]
GAPSGAPDATVLDMAQMMAAGGGTIDSGPPPGSKVIVVAGRGVGQNTSTEPGRVQFEVPLYDVLTGEKVGRSTHDFICDGFFTCTDTDTYYLPQGSIEVTAPVSFNNDGARPGWVLVGAAPKDQPLKGTGEFAGKTGSVRVNGWAGLEDMSSQMRLDEIYVITYR